MHEQCSVDCQRKQLKLVQTGPNWFKPVQTGWENWFKLLKPVLTSFCACSVDCHRFPCRDWIKLVQTCWESNWFKLAGGTGLNWFTLLNQFLLQELDQTGSNWIGELVVHKQFRDSFKLAVRTGSNCSNQFLWMSSVVTDSPLLTGSNWFKLAVSTCSN